MDLKEIFDEEFLANEKPLDNLVTDGGYCSIFRTIACVGDSLSSGEFQITTPDGKVHYNDYYEYSWGQYIARMAGCKVYNFSKGGMTAKQYLDSFADDRGFWNKDLASQAYIYALGCNDLNGHKQPVGSVDDIHDDDPASNPETFAGYMGRLVERYRKIAPDAKIFFVTMPAKDRTLDDNQKKQAELMRAMAAHYPNAYCIDLYTYGPEYNDKFKEKFYLSGHMNPMGYLLTAKMIASYIDWIIRHNMQDFVHSGYINTALSDSKILEMKKSIEARKAAEEAKNQ